MNIAMNFTIVDGVPSGLDIDASSGNIMTDVRDMAAEFVDQMAISEDFEADLRLLMPPVVYAALQEQAEGGEGESLSPDDVDRWLSWDSVQSLATLDMPEAFTTAVQFYLEMTSKAKHEAMLAHILSQAGEVPHG